MFRKTSVLIVDDSPTVRADLRTLLDLLQEVTVVGEAARVSDVIPIATAVDPDVVIMDLEMGGPGAAELGALPSIRELKRVRPSTYVFVLTVHGYPTARQAALSAGADLFFVKGQDTDSLLRAVGAASVRGTFS
jgi:two-component system nitrate/nitrite response regulator NarL